jgi:hypothetical protein
MAEHRVVSQYQLAIGTPAHIQFDRIGDLRGRDVATEGVVRETSRPPAVTDDEKNVAHVNNPEKSIYNRDIGQYRSVRNSPKHLRVRLVTMLLVKKITK